MTKLNSAFLLQSSESHDPSEIILYADLKHFLKNNVFFLIIS